MDSNRKAQECADAFKPLAQLDAGDREECRRVLATRKPIEEIQLALADAERDERRLRGIWLDAHSMVEGPERIAWQEAMERRKKLFEMLVEEKTRKCQ